MCAPHSVGGGAHIRHIVARGCAAFPHGWRLWRGVCVGVCVCVSPRHPTVNRYLENQLKRSVRAKAALRPRPIHQKTDNETCLWPFNPNRLFHRQLINNTKECRGWTVRWVFGHDELFREASPVCWSVGLTKNVFCASVNFTLKFLDEATSCPEAKVSSETYSKVFRVWTYSRQKGAFGKVRGFESLCWQLFHLET